MVEKEWQMPHQRTELYSKIYFSFLSGFHLSGRGEMIKTHSLFEGFLRLLSQCQRAFLFVQCDGWKWFWKISGDSVLCQATP
ncbi:CLUMA_CG007954, isoform A [Clunio marinus]|uniref:CLUMA_CG007954, isoform A n=1 Tax=Clunio marinus TaxID=568069 RepID=A0A1J1I286_9DIPT|nr:CLUMA_CG007954, isoform A [Clunio marinus]